MPNDDEKLGNEFAHANRFTADADARCQEDEAELRQERARLQADYRRCAERILLKVIRECARCGKRTTRLRPDLDGDHYVAKCGVCHRDPSGGEHD